MKFKKIVIASLALMSCLTSVTVAQDNSFELWYEQPAKEWVEALPIGNGRLGAMVFGGIAEERIQFNESTLYMGEPHDYSRPDAHKHLEAIRKHLFDGEQKAAERLAMRGFMSDPLGQVSYQPFADMIFKFSGHEGATNYRRDLNIDEAVATTSYEVAGVKYTREVIASYPDQVIAIHVSSDGAGKLSFSTGFKSPHQGVVSYSESNNNLVMQGVLPNFYKKKSKKGLIKVKTPLQFVAKMEIRNDGGSVNFDDGLLHVKDSNSVTIVMTAATSFKNFQDVSGDPNKRCDSFLTKVKNKKWDALKADHMKDYQDLYRRVSINLGSGENEGLPTDARLQKLSQAQDPGFVSLLYQYGRYLLISSSRPGGQPSNLQGIWNDKLSPPWGSRYTVNINTEMNYWPAEMTNLSECHEPLLEVMKELAISGAQTASNHYKARGWVLHHNFDLWRGTAPINGSNHGVWPTGGAWLCQHLWWHYEFGGDRDFLEEFYPIIRDAALFFVDFLIVDPRNDKGWLISTPSNSPENKGMVAGPTMDHQIIRSLFSNVIEAAEILDKDTELVKQLREMKSQIAPNKVGKHGQLQEWLEDRDDPNDTHRHVSHLWGLHPGEEINWQDTPELFKAAKQSLVFRGDQATGWSMGWKVNFWARLLDGDHARLILGNLMKPVAKKGGKMLGGGGLYPNLFDAHPPFQVDGNLGATAGITEMLLQSHLKGSDGARMLHLLPALPSEWKNGSVTGLRAKGGFEIDISWEDGELDSYKVHSILGNPCFIYDNKTNLPIKLEKGSSYVWSSKK